MADFDGNDFEAADFFVDDPTVDPRPADQLQIENYRGFETIAVSMGIPVIPGRSTVPMCPGVLVLRESPGLFRIRRSVDIGPVMIIGSHPMASAAGYYIYRPGETFDVLMPRRGDLVRIAVPGTQSVWPGQSFGCTDGGTGYLTSAGVLFSCEQVLETHPDRYALILARVI